MGSWHSRCFDAVMRRSKLFALFAVAALAACAGPTLDEDDDDGAKKDRTGDVPDDKPDPPGARVPAASPVQPARPPVSLYDDSGPANDATPVRAVFSFAVRDTQALDAIDDPASPSFHQFITRDAWLTAHAPLEADFDDVKAWLMSQGFTIPHAASNRMLMEVSGTVGKLQSVFGTEVHVFDRKTAGNSKALDQLLGVVKPVVIPDAVKGKTRGMLVIAPGASTEGLPAESPTKEDQPRNVKNAFVPQQLSAHYGIDALAANGDGETIGIVMGAGFKRPDVRAFWKAFGITREDPEIVTVGEGPSARAIEASLDVEWAGGLAPGAHVVAYQAADVHDLSLLLAFNEAIGAGRATVITDSFAHRETNVSKAVAQQYELSAQMAAAMGVTIVAPTGDSSGADVPATCPHVTAVGGTRLSLGDGKETVWSETGAGPSSYFGRPAWQTVSTNDRRVIPDVALAADPESPYWILHLGSWDPGGGTSFSSPVFAAVIADVNAQRRAAGKTRVGFLNPVLYGNEAVRGSFRDVVSGSAAATPATAGWDSASGWGSPRAKELATTLP